MRNLFADLIACAASHCESCGLDRAREGDMSRQFFLIIGLLFILAASAATAKPQTPNASQPSLPAEEQLPVPSAAQAGDHFDPLAATNAYLATVPADKKARSDAYFEGGYWLVLWDFLASAAVYFLLLATGWSARMRNLSERITRFKPLQTFLYWVQFLAVTSVIVFPFTVYRDFVREHAYGLATQTFGLWLGDKLKFLAVEIVLGGLFLIVIYGVLRRAPRSWWIWGSAVTIVFQVFTAVIAPVYIAPLFNKYTELDDPRVKDPILSMARANGIPASDVYVMDASRQSTRVSANVSGFLGTERITLNDNLLKRCTLPEIEAVMGHEMGHYVVNHVYKLVLFFGVLTVLGFAFLRWAAIWAADPLGRLVAGARCGRHRRAPALRSSRRHLRLRAHAHHEHLRPGRGIRGGYLRPERGSPARRRGSDRLETGRLSQARPRARRGVCLLRSPERPSAHPRGDAVEGGAPEGGH